MKRSLTIGLKVIGLTIILFLLFVVFASVLGQQPDQGQATPEKAATAALALLAVCFLNTAVLGYLILRSRWSGWRLIASVFLIFYGVMTVMSQIESAVFITRLPQGMLPRLFVMGALIAGSFSPIAVLILGKGRRGTGVQTSNPWPVPTRTGWAWRLSAISIVYLVLYFSFGYYVAWKNPAVREYYGGVDSGGFVASMRSTLSERPWLPFFQILRAMMWTLIAMPVIRMSKGRWWEAALAVGALFAVLMNAQLLLPNPYMPFEVRMTHLLETASSNFIFGLLLVGILSYGHSPARQAA